MESAEETEIKAKLIEMSEGSVEERRGNNEKIESRGAYTVANQRMKF